MNHSSIITDQQSHREIYIHYIWDDGRWDYYKLVFQLFIFDELKKRAENNFDWN